MCYALGLHTSQEFAKAQTKTPAQRQHKKQGRHHWGLARPHWVVFRFPVFWLCLFRLLTELHEWELLTKRTNCGEALVETAYVLNNTASSETAQPQNTNIIEVIVFGAWEFCDFWGSLSFWLVCMGHPKGNSPSYGSAYLSGCKSG